MNIPEAFREVWEDTSEQVIEEWLNKYEGVVKNSLEQSGRIHVSFIGFTQEQVEEVGLPEGVLREQITNDEQDMGRVDRAINNTYPHQIVVVAAELY